MAKPISSIEPRFWSKVDKSSSPNGCWIWTASEAIRSGYGQFGIRKGQLGCSAATMMAAHRVAWILTNGAIPLKIYVCHKCDRPRCVNPDHLFLGTQSDNMKDCVAKNRHGFGTVGGPLHYTASTRKKIFDAYAKGVLMRDILERYEISETHLLRILKQHNIPMRGGGCRKLTTVQVQQIRELYALGNTTHEKLAQRFKVSPATIGLVIQRKVWANVP